MDTASPPAPPAAELARPSTPAQAARPPLPTLRDPADPLGAACVEARELADEQRRVLGRVQLRPRSKR